MKYLVLAAVLIIGGMMLYPSFRWHQYNKACEAAGGYADLIGSGDFFDCERNSGEHESIEIPGFEREEGNK